VATTENITVLFTDLVGSTELASSLTLEAGDDVRHKHFYTNMLWGRMLSTRSGPGDSDRARELLEQTHECAAARGYAGVERQANAELSRLS